MADVPGVFLREDLLQHVVEIRYSPFDAIEIVYPDDAGFDFVRDGESVDRTQTPDEGSLEVGDTIMNKRGTDTTVPIVEVIFAEDNPIGDEIYGEWQRRLLQTVPVHFSVPTITLVDDIDPNPYHDGDQQGIDIWRDYWVGYFDTQYDNEVANNTSQLADFNALYADQLTRVFTASNWTEVTGVFEPTEGWDSFVTYSFNTNLTIHSSVGTYFSADTETVSYTRKTIVATAGTDDHHPQNSEGISGFGLRVVLHPVVTSFVDGDVWVQDFDNRDVFIINRSKIGTAGKIDVVVSRRSGLPGDAANGTIIYYRGVSGVFTIGAERTVVFGAVASQTTTVVSFDQADDTVLISFDATGLVE